MRYILDLKDHPDLNAEHQAWINKHKEFEERWTFLKKQIQTLEEENEKTDQDFWEKAAAYLRLKGLHPEHKPEDGFLEIDMKSRQLFLQDHQPPPLEALFASMKPLGGGFIPGPPKGRS